jgi:L-threonylcarbamoyladenylate synthase
LPPVVSAGLDTVAIRFPATALARELITLSGLKLVAPSANRSGRPSPTAASHVLEDFLGKIPFILDGGSCEVGVESTVLDLTGKTPVILRPGAIVAPAIASVIGREVIYFGRGEGPPRSPGLFHRHYAPEAKVEIVNQDDDWPGLLQARLTEKQDDLLSWRYGRIGLFCAKDTLETIFNDLTSADRSRLCFETYDGSPSPAEASRRLYAVLRALDAASCDLILAQGFAKTGAGIAYMDRLERAAGAVGIPPCTEPKRAASQGQIELSPEKQAIRKVVFVCTGNTCRSPMAEAFFTALAPEHWVAGSAGLFAYSGDEATLESIEVMREVDLDLSSHRSTRLSPELVDETSLFVAMTGRHAEVLRQLFPERADSVRTLLSGQDVPDPFGCGIYTYRKTRDVIRLGVDALISELREKDGSGA